MKALTVLFPVQEFIHSHNEAIHRNMYLTYLLSKNEKPTLLSQEANSVPEK